MFSLFYNLILLLIGIIALPRLLWAWARYGKYRESFPSRLGARLPSLPKKEGPTFWIHTISFGETRAVIPLFKKMRAAYPDANIIISTITETGHAEAKKSMKEADAHFFLPLDFSWVIRKAVSKYSPRALILVESDFWYHLLRYSKQNSAAILLVNGKMSERSLSRFKTFSLLTRRLFPLFDHLCIQSKRYAERFLELGIPPEKITVTGNIKLDVAPKILSPQEKKQWQEELGINPQDRVLVVGSTHDPEEEQILGTLSAVWSEIPNLKVLLVPRHPERFPKVKELLRAKQIPTLVYSERTQRTGQEKVLLIDAMGILNTCYQLADLAIVAGSFTDKVGGHNIFEPVALGVPVLYGPHMYTQLDLVQLLQNAGVGQQITLSELAKTVLDLLQDSALMQKMQKACLATAEEAKGSTERTWKMIEPYLKH